MKNFFIAIVTRINESFWLIPVLMMVAANVFAIGALVLDHHGFAANLKDVAWIFRNDAQGSRSVLSAIAGSMITVAGVVFSITIVVLTLASNQYGPRMIRNFIRDRTNQFAVGTFVATFFYCIIILGSIENYGDEPFVPHIAVNLGVALSIASLIVLVYYLHHVAASIRPEFLIKTVSDEFTQCINSAAVWNGGTDHGEAPNGTFDANYARGLEVRASSSGYVQAVDYELLCACAAKYESIVRLRVTAGDFVYGGVSLGEILTNNTVVHESVLVEFQEAILIGTVPTANQDPEFAIRQLVEIAVRALSPGTNDPFTAMAAIDNLCAGFVCLTSAELREEICLWRDGVPRVSAPSFSFEDLAHAAFTQLRQYAVQNIDVSIRLLERLADLYDTDMAENRKRVIYTHARRVAEQISPTIRIDFDADKVDACLARFEHHE